MSTLGEQLREVRQHSGKSQAEFGEIGGVRKQAQLHYESGKRKPPAEYLVALAAAGYDVGYIVTGMPTSRAERQIRHDAAAVAQIAEYMRDISDYARNATGSDRQQVTGHDLRYRELTADEDGLVGDYRRCDSRGKIAIRNTAQALAGGGAQPTHTTHHVSADRGSVAGGRDVHVGTHPGKRRK